MTQHRCSRLWMVEAVRDGRLSGSERDAFEGHRSTCKACAEEAHKLEHLGRDLCALAVGPPDPVTIRRERMRLLARVNEELAALPEGRRRAVRLSLCAAALLVVACALVVWLRVRVPPATPPAQAANTPDEVDVVGDTGARWSRRRDGNVDKVIVDDGTIRLRVHRKDNTRFLVILPDGEIEDEGTSFVVEVRSRQTLSVAVDEGVVALRLAESSELTLRGGDRWVRPQAITCESSSPAPAASAPSMRVRQELPPAAPRDPSGQTGAATVSDVRPSQASNLPSSAGSASPNATREEDALYMRAVWLLRSRRNEEARQAAREYLRRFPNGFRRVEMEQISR